MSEHAFPSVEELIERAHLNAVRKGFWESGNVGEHFALIATEVAEFEDAFDTGPSDPLEELADVVIRVFDLCGYLSLSLPSDILSYHEKGASLLSFEFELRVYRCIARATQSHRKRDLGRTQDLLVDAVFWCSTLAVQFAGAGELEQAILKKMEKNEKREYKHGCAY